jgi:hypothetical protein
MTADDSHLHLLQHHPNVSVNTYTIYSSSAGHVYIYNLECFPTTMQETDSWLGIACKKISLDYSAQGRPSKEVSLVVVVVQHDAS